MEQASCKFRNNQFRTTTAGKNFVGYRILFFHLIQILFSFSVNPQLLFASRNCSHYYPVAAEILSENVFIRELFSLSPNPCFFPVRTVHYLSRGHLGTFCAASAASLTDRHSSIKHHIPSLPTSTWKEKRRWPIRQRKGWSHSDKYFDASNNR